MAYRVRCHVSSSNLVLWYNHLRVHHVHFDECRTIAKWPLTTIPSLITWAVSPYVGCYRIRASLCLLSLVLRPEADIYITSHRGWKTESTRHCAVRNCSLCPRLYITVFITTDIQLPMVAFNRWTLHTAFSHILDWTVSEISLYGWTEWKTSGVHLELYVADLMILALYVGYVKYCTTACFYSSCATFLA